MRPGASTHPAAATILESDESDTSDIVAGMARLTATELARNLSAVLDRVSTGERIEVVRNGTPVAVITRPDPYLISAEAFRELLESLPEADEDFAVDIDALRGELPPLDDPWES